MIPPARSSSGTAELRAGYRLLKNAGFLPPELALRREIRQVEELLLQVETDGEEKNLMGRLSLLRARLAREGRETGPLMEEAYYRQKLLQRIDR